MTEDILLKEKLIASQAELNAIKEGLTTAKYHREIYSTIILPVPGWREKTLIFLGDLLSYIILSGFTTLITVFIFNLPSSGIIIMVWLGVSSGVYLYQTRIIFGYCCNDCRTHNRKGLIIDRIPDLLYYLDINSANQSEKIFLCQNCIHKYPDIFDVNCWNFESIPVFDFKETSLGYINSIKPIRFKKELIAIRKFI